MHNEQIFLRDLERFLGHEEFDFNTPRSTSDLVINTMVFNITRYGSDTKVINRFSENMPESICTPYPNEHNPRIIFKGPEVLVYNLGMTGFEYRITEGKMIVPRMIFIQKLLNMSELSAYYYMYKQQLLFNYINK